MPNADRSDRPRTARVVLAYGPSEGGFTGEILLISPVDAPPPPWDFELPEDPVGAWLDVIPPGEHEPAFQVPLPDPRWGDEVAEPGGRLQRLDDVSEQMTVAFEVPWYGEGTRIVLRLGDGTTLDTRSRGDPALSLRLSLEGWDDAEVRGAERPSATPVQRLGHDNPRALPLIILGDAFLAGEEQLYDEAVERCIEAIEGMASLQPWLRALMPVKMFVPSATSQIGTRAGNTAFGAHWRSATENERLIKADEGRIQRAARNVAGRRNWQTILVVNTTSYGGSGGATAIVSRDPNSIGEVLIHELGHSLFRLGDEYSGASGYKSNGTPVYPNISKGYAPPKLKWHRLVPSGTPLPTPEDQPDHRVGAYKGAFYSDSKYYRPAFTCRMRDLTADFCPVCTQEIGGLLSRHV